MKVVPQLITFAVLLAISWFAYENHQAFHKLVNDIGDYAGFTQQQTTKTASVTSDDVDIKNADARGTDQPAVIEPDPADDVVETVAEQSNDAQLNKVSEDQQHKSVMVETDPVPVSQINSEQLTEGSEQRPTNSSKSVEDSPAQVVQAVAEATSEKIQEMIDSITTPQEQLLPESMPVDETDSVTPDQTTGGESQSTVLQNTDTSAQVNTPIEENVTNMVEVHADEPTIMPMPVLDPAETGRSAPVKSVPEVAANAPQSGMEQRKHAALTGLRTARQAWQEGHEQEAIDYYLYLMNEYRNHPDFAGELGNIYFSQGKIELAVNAYSEAVVRLMKNGDIERARKTHAIIHNLDQEQSAILQEYFTPLR